MKKINRVLIVIITSILLLLFSVGISNAAFADTGAGIDPPATSVETETDGLAETFLARLKEKYGDDYEYYYNLIIENWGSVENYLLSVGDKLPDEYQSDWDKFVGWLGEYAPVWASVLAIIMVIVILLIGRNGLKKFKEWCAALIEKLVNKRLSPIEKELNLQSKSLLTLLHSQKALLAGSEKFADTVREIENTEQELGND